jgi:predicted dehydrogenase
MSQGPLRVGVIGVGVISAQYFASFPSIPALRLTAVADLDRERAALVAAEQGVVALSVDELLASTEVDVVLNLTIPAVHAEVALRAIAAGKHVYGEKPLALTIADGRRVLEAAAAAGVRVWSAPDTVLGTGIQTARRALEDGRIGRPVAAACFWASPGHELWHPAPDFYYREGGGPLLDMGPYYLTALVTLLGPVVRVDGASLRSDRERRIATGPREGTALGVEVDTHVTAILTHASGVVSTVTVSFEVWASRNALFEVYGTEGTLAVPDPNTFSGDTEAFTRESGAWSVEPVGAGFERAGRGVGLADLAVAVRTGRPERASGALALHVLEIMEAVLTGGATTLSTTADAPAPVPLGSAESLVE